VEYILHAFQPADRLVQVSKVAYFEGRAVGGFHHRANRHLGQGIGRNHHGHITHRAAHDAGEPVFIYPFLGIIGKNAKFLGAVNTIHNRDGKLFGYNTDGIGALTALKENGANPKGIRVLLLGCGGAARAIAYTLSKEADELVILNRTVSEAKELASLLKKTLGKKAVAEELSADKIKAQIADSDILINATSVGMKPKANQSLTKPEWLKPNLTVMDIVYNPIETKLAKDAKSAGAKVVNGLEMLIYQGAASFEIWTKKQAPVKVMREAALNHLSKV